MKIYEIGTGYTSIPAQMGAATEIVVEELSRALLKSGHEVYVVDIQDKNRKPTDLRIIEVPMPQYFNRTDTKLGVVHKLKRVIYSLSLTRKLHQLVKKEKEQVVLHFHNQYNLYFYLKLTSKKLLEKTKIIYTVHSYIWQGEWEAIQETVKKRYFQEIYCCQQADQVFVLNEKTKEHFVKHLGISKDKIRVIANGVNTSVYYPMSENERLELKKRMGYEGKTVFFQAGSVCERKNQLTSVQLLSKLMQRNKDYVFLYAGGIIDPEYKNSIDSFAASHNIANQVIYMGELTPGKSLNEYYNIAEAFLFPSTSEGFSLVILEAMSAGLPVFVDANAGIKLPNDGKNCFIYFDEKDFHQKIDEVLQNPAFYRAEARKCIEQNYSWDSVAQDYLK